MDKLVVLFDGDELVCDVKALCTKPVETIGINYINHSQGKSILAEGSIIDSYTHDEIVIQTDRLIQQRLNEIQSNFPDVTTDKVLIALSMRDNFRKQIDINYKKKTNKKFNSFLNPDIRQHLIDRYGVYDKDTNPRGQILIEKLMEADDKIGIAATSLHNKILAQGDTPHIVISSQDKDMNTIPNTYMHNPNTSDISYKTHREALEYYLMQLLMGDRADGVEGVKGFGSVSAKRFIDERASYSIANIYKDIKAQYAHAGRQSECIKNAQLLKILTVDNYDFNNQAIKLIDETYF